MLVMKFGGASLADAESMLHLGTIVKKYSRDHKMVVVASAMKGVTDMLFQIGELLKKKELDKTLEILQDIKKLHFFTLQDLMRDKDGIRTEIELIKQLSHLENYIKNISRKEITNARTDYLASFGERLSIRLLAEALEKSGTPAYPVDASNLLATTHDFGNAIPLPREKQVHLDKIITPLLEKSIVPVVTGYIGYSEDGCTTTLGRGGSDLTATFLANFLNADGVYLWKDVPGFFDKDPHKYKDAKMHEKLSYNEAERLAKAGAKVIYYKAIEPLRKKHIPLYVKSYIDIDAEGTTIS